MVVAVVRMRKGRASGAGIVGERGRRREVLLRSTTCQSLDDGICTP